MEFLNYFDNVFTVYHIALLVGGTFAGIILGALPGLSPTMSVALLIPFTFHMKPESGLILLGAMYTATVAGGAISAILVNVPGAPANIATALMDIKWRRTVKLRMPYIIVLLVHLLVVFLEYLFSYFLLHHLLHCH